MSNNYFRYSVLFLIAYEISIIFLSPPNGSLLKLIITFLFVGSIIALFFYFYKYYLKHRQLFNKTFVLLIILLIYGFFNILISLEFDFQTITTLFGNKNTGLAMLLPLTVILGTSVKNILWYNHISLKLIKYIYFFYPVSIILNIFELYITFHLSFIFLPIVLYPYQNNFDKKIIVFTSIFILIAALVLTGRLAVLQIVFLWLGVLFYYLYRRIHLKFIRNFIIASLVSIPLIIIIVGFPIFSYIASGRATLATIETTDTRTFLYEEVIDDLKNSNSLWFGKGATGVYHSAYFAQGVEGGDAADRINVEVGVLSMLLKGGIINLVLNFILLLYAIYYAFKSNNKFTEYLAILVLCHFLSLFIANIPQYSIFSFTIWIAIGGCLSTAVRKPNDKMIASTIRKFNYIKQK